MNREIKEGDYFTSDNSCRVHKVLGFICHSNPTLPKGWIIADNEGIFNPKFCKKYEGAISVIEDE